MLVNAVVNAIGSPTQFHTARLALPFTRYHFPVAHLALNKCTNTVNLIICLRTIQKANQGITFLENKLFFGISWNHYIRQFERQLPSSSSMQPQYTDNLTTSVKEPLLTLPAFWWKSLGMRLPIASSLLNMYYTCTKDDIFVTYCETLHGVQVLNVYMWACRQICHFSLWPVFSDYGRSKWQVCLY